MSSRGLLTKQLTVGILALFCIAAFSQKSHAESLFKAGIAYHTTQAYTPRSLFAFPRPTSIGDMITININESTLVNVQNTGNLQKQHEITENGTQVANNIVKKLFGLSQLLPTANGLNNNDKTTITGRAQKIYTFTDSVTCQVVQILPNGNLVVQGKKTLNANQEAQDLFVSGIVNPYYLDGNNAIVSNKVAGLQMNIAQRGMTSRIQGDGIWSKYLRIFN